tara:strand:- start:597 stop:941 length:345 start_codon:yes stop_codon:yes gene_type:complete
MAINYEYDVSTVDTFPTKNSKSDVVHKIHWKILATDDANNDANGNPQTATVYGSQSLDTSDLSSFKDFADLKSSDVQGWLEKALGEEKINSIKAGLTAQIAEKVTPTSVTKTIG